MIHLILATFESGQGFCIYDDNTLSEKTPNLGDGCDSSDYYPRFIRALYDFAKEISKEKKFRIHKVDVGDYYLLLFDTGETLWGFFCDFFDNIPFIETKIMKIIKLLDPVVRNADTTRPLKISNSLQQQLDEILATQVFPEDKLEEIDTLIQKLDKTEQVTITHIYLLDLDGGIIRSWEPSRDYIDSEARRKLFRLISGLPFHFQTRLELSVDIGSNEDEGWKILRLGNTEFAMCFRVLYATDHRALLNVITERVCERITKLIGNDIKKVSTELSHWNAVEVQTEDFFDFDYKAT